jgi:hypothetical protein
MTLPPTARVRRGNQIYKNYSELAGALGENLALHPGELGKRFAVHEAELALLRVVMAIGAKRDDKGFPDSLSELRGVFGGRVPTSPYDGSTAYYQLSSNAKSFHVTYGETIILPAVSFSSSVPTPPEK